MIEAQAVELTPRQGVDLMRSELGRARQALAAGDLPQALDGFVPALGLALQLGPAATEEVLTTILDAARHLAAHDPAGLSVLGPSLTALVHNVQEAGALPSTAPMRAWASIAEGLSTLISRLGLALALPEERRAAIMTQAETQALLLDDVTDSLFHLHERVAEIAAAASNLPPPTNT